MNLVTLAVCGIALVTLGCESSQKLPETLVTEGYDEKAMDKAIEASRGTVDYFLKAFEQGEGSDFSVKAPITDSNGTEHFWIVDLKYAEGAFEGLVGNEPGIVENVKLGDRWTIKKEEISDWMFLRDEMMHGGYTVRVLMNTMEPEAAAQMAAKLADLPE